MENNERYVQIENVHKTFGGAAGSEVLRNVSLTVRKGEFVSIIGHSGCGKSTLLNIVAGLTPATSGNVFVDLRRVLEVGQKHVLELRGECRIEDDRVGFVIVQEAQVVQVAAAYRGPVAVHDHGFCVQDLFLAFEYLDSRLQ